MFSERRRKYARAWQKLIRLKFVENTAERPVPAESHCKKFKNVRKLDRDIGGGGGSRELSGVLTARKLLIPGTATRAKKAPLPYPLYVLLYENAFRSPGVLNHHIGSTVSHRFAKSDREKTQASCDTPKSRHSISSLRPLAP